MMNRNLARGIFLCAISLAFGIGAARYPIGEFSRAGPGLFPLMVSALLLLIGISTVIRAFLVEKVPMEVNPKNIAIILGSLCAFALVSEFANMILGIVAMVFIASLAATTYSVSRILKISLGLVLVGLAFQKGLGFNLPLY
ncbi:tripartite tricarboxylate transporter TctB family protein [Caenimonas koreensis]|uniref:Tripartite tricarboxylate transporter TctB family protein n=1 Tax=Caenimonas koreensis DSM 17982 TaxID=1121255 RepID=A0A844B6M3_9BURK|nr:tripartite tricarboxylate transporter TctB family protein [Caenimonas koreensis]MRD48812.1 tripartite tricarboxylate transporter TctB family protein [Caenimonas koreensis DSM 17982]